MVREFNEFPYVDFDKSVTRCLDLLQQAHFVQKGHHHEEAAMFYEIAAGLHDDGIDGYVLELGRFCGASTIVLAKALTDYKLTCQLLYSIDNNSWYWEGQIIAQLGFQRLGIDNVVQIIGSDYEFINEFWRSKTRMIFVDSNHGYDYVKALTDLCFPKVCSGGWILFHDYNSRHKDDVVEVVNELVDEYVDSIEVYREQMLVGIKKMAHVKRKCKTQKA